MSSDQWYEMRDVGILHKKMYVKSIYNLLVFYGIKEGEYEVHVLTTTQETVQKETEDF